MTKKIIIIGGGAAGMMAAATIIEKKNEETGGEHSNVILIERNRKLGFKVLLSGGGRCNVTTGLPNVEEILKKYPRGAKFLKTAMYNFPPQKLCKWITQHGVPLKTEKDLRVFPKSDEGKDIVNIFGKILLNSNAEVFLDTTVKNIQKKDEKFEIEFNYGKNMIADKVILTTGGQAYQETGSLGDGYKFAQSLGHKITKLAPSLSAFLIKENFPKKLSGVSFEKVNLSLKGREGKKYEFTGPILFTHRGMTGPAVFALSALMAFEDFSETEPGKLSLDFAPDFSYEKLHEILNQEFQEAPTRLFEKTCAMFAPRSVISSLFEQKGINPELRNSEAGKKNLNLMVEMLKNSPLNIIGICSGEEFVTAGGVSLAEVDSKTMESKICPGLYFAGEILDVDGFTGGFNLQAAWATGRLAGENV